MVDNQQETQVPETETQEGAIPTPEQNTSEPVEATQDADTSQVPEPAITENEPELPSGTKERTTQQFEKLKNQLADERERRLRAERTFQPQVTESSIPDWYDADSGTVDVKKLQSERAQQAQTMNQLQRQLQTITKREEIQQEQEAYVSHPALDPKSGDFDGFFQEQVVNSMAVAYAKGENPTLKQTADRIMKISEKVAKKAEKVGAQKALEQITPKEQAALQATGRSDRRLPATDHSALRNKTRGGGRSGLQAAMARLSKIPSVG